MDDAAQVTCTSDRTLLFNYRPYGPDSPCLVRLRPVGQDVVRPEGEGVIFIPAPAPFHCYGFRTFYSPHLNTTLLSECDFHTDLG
jgi:hypothetical protein